MSYREITTLDADKLLAEFASGRLIRPSAGALNIVDFANALASLAGVTGLNFTPGAQKIAELIGPAEHLVFVLVDGFGMNFVKHMNGNAFIRNHVAAEMQTVFPSTTPVVETTLATGKWPNEHAVTGWETFLPEIDIVATIIRFQNRTNDRPLTEYGLTPQQAYPLPSQIGLIPRNFLAIMPDSILGTVYTDYWTGNKPQLGYKALRDAVDMTIRRVGKAETPTFTYIYTSQVDYNAHSYGVRHKKTTAQVAEVDRELQRLRQSLPNDARVVMTADHGLLDASKSEMHRISYDDELVGCLNKEPSGDKRILHFDVKEEKLSTFERLFKERFGDKFLLVTTDNAEDMELFGPGTPSEVTRKRIGNLIAISTGADTLGYDWRGKVKEPPKISYHSGLTPDEMLIPLVVA